MVIPRIRKSLKHLKYCTRLLTGLNDIVNAYDDDDFSSTKVKEAANRFGVLYCQLFMMI